LLTERSFSEFIFRFDYQTLSDLGFGAVWWTLPGEMPPLYNPTASTFAVATNRNSAWLFSNVKPSELKEGEGWNMVKVEARNRLLRISVNGKEVIRKALPEKPAEPTALRAPKPDGAFPRIGMDRRNGRVGFQVLKGTGRFRNIEIEELPRSEGGERPSPRSAVEANESLVEEPAVKAPGLPKPQPTAPENPPKSITNSIGMKLVIIPAGTFLMGSPNEDMDANGDETPRHPVRITRPFYLGVTEVTRGQFRRFVDDAGYQSDAEKDGNGGFGWNEETKYFKQNPRYTWRNPGFEQTDDHPVVNVSWNDTVAFAQWLSRKEGKTYRLPTEAEWEYACRAGSTTRFSNGDNEEALAAVGNVADGTAREKYPDWTGAIAARDGYVYTAPVGRFQPNALGLYDMHGNVWEWCSDGYAPDYYGYSPMDDPRGDFGAAPGIRGGSWYRDFRVCRSASRLCFRQGARYSHIGFRVALVQSGP
jgi:formylglycine-generating enzyme required for sulfatase activity